MGVVGSFQEMEMKLSSLVSSGEGLYLFICVVEVALLPLNINQVCDVIRVLVLLFILFHKSCYQIIFKIFCLTERTNRCTIR